MKKLIQIITIIAITLFTLFYFLDSLEYSDAEKVWCMEHRPSLPIKICAKEFGYQMKNLFQNAFFKECVIKLGSIYILLFILSFIFLEYRTTLSMSWMNGLIFATHDEIAFTIFSLMFVTFSYGFYSWVKAFFKFVFKIQIWILRFVLMMTILSQCQ